MRLGDVMTRRVESVSPDSTLEEAAQRMRRADVGALPVCEGGRLVGMITDRDIVVRAVAIGHDPSRLSVSEVASRDVVVGREAQPIDEAERLMQGRGIRRLPVVDEDHRLIGMVSVDDLASRGREVERAGRVLAATTQTSGSQVESDQGERMSRKNTFEQERQEPMTRNRYGMTGEGNDNDRNYNRDDERYGQRSSYGRDDDYQRERGFSGQRGFNQMNEYGEGGQRGGQFGGGQFGGQRGGEWGGGGQFGGQRGGFQNDYYGQQHGRGEGGFQDYGSSQHGMRGSMDEDRWYNSPDQGMGRGGSFRQGGQGMGYGQGMSGQHMGGQGMGGQGMGGQHMGYGQHMGGQHMGGQGGMGYGQGMGQGGMSRNRGPKGYKRSDERIREDLCDRLSDRHDVDSSDIEVKVQNGEVILSGTVRERYLKHTIEQIAEAISGVQDVKNEIRVKREETETRGASTGTGTGTSTGTTTGTADRTQQESRTQQEGRRNASS